MSFAPATNYEFPEFQFNKILYVEKQGIYPILEAAQLGQRYDMGIIAGQGYATEACRALFAKADKERDYFLFVLHDADPYGYEIARTLREETRRMPGYKVDVIDTGLGLEEALTMGLLTEEYTRKKALPAGLKLTDLEHEYFEGQREYNRSWICQRVELNAMTASQLVEYIEGKLRQYGATEKVLPSAEYIRQKIDNECGNALRQWIANELASLVDIDALVREVAPRLAGGLKDTLSLEKVKDWLNEDRKRSWRDIVESQVAEVVREARGTSLPALIKAVYEALRARASSDRG